MAARAAVDAKSPSDMIVQQGSSKLCLSITFGCLGCFGVLCVLHCLNRPWTQGAQVRGDRPCNMANTALKLVRRLKLVRKAVAVSAAATFTARVGVDVDSCRRANGAKCIVRSQQVTMARRPRTRAAERTIAAAGRDLTTERVIARCASALAGWVSQIRSMAAMTASAMAFPWLAR